MKKMILIGAFSICSICSYTQNSIQLDLSSSVLGLGYERVLTKNISAQITIQYNSPWYIDLLVSNTDVIGYGGDIRIHYYFLSLVESKHNWYVSPFIRMAKISSTKDLNRTVKGIGIGTGFIVGHQWSFKKPWLLKLGLGPMFWNYEIKDKGETAGYKGIIPQIDIGFAYKF